MRMNWHDRTTVAGFRKDVPDVTLSDGIYMRVLLFDIYSMFYCRCISRLIVFLNSS